MNDESPIRMETNLEHILTHSYKADLIRYMNSHPEDFDELISLAIKDVQPYSWRAAWLLWSCMEPDDPRVHKHIRQIINGLTSKNDDQLRELMIVLRRMEVDEAVEGKLFDICVGVWEKIGKKPSVRFNAFKLISKIAGRHPELSHEIEFLLDPRFLESLSQTARKSIQVEANYYMSHAKRNKQL